MWDETDVGDVDDFSWTAADELLQISNQNQSTGFFSTKQ